VEPFQGVLERVTLIFRVWNVSKEQERWAEMPCFICELKKEKSKG
jgi:hypothetical protein